MKSIKKPDAAGKDNNGPMERMGIFPMPPLDHMGRYRFRYHAGRLLLLTTYIYFYILSIAW